MLILTRKIGEAIMIGDEIKITILGCAGNQVRVGTDAPKSVAIYRTEVYERIQNEKKEKPPAPDEQGG